MSSAIKRSDDTGSLGGQPPLVSVIVPFFNAEQFIREAIESVLAQSYPHWELLLIDDGSTDSSSSIARDAARRLPHKVRYLQHPGGANRGACASRNLGIRHASGALIGLLDADDVWLPHKLEEQLEIMARYPHVGMVYGLPRYWYSWAESPGEASDSVPSGAAYVGRTARPGQLSLFSYPLGIGTAPCPSDILIRRAVVEEVGGFEEGFYGPFQLYEDQAFLAKVHLACSTYVADRTWILYRQHPESCVAIVRASRDVYRVRAFFFQWYLRYLEQHPSIVALRLRIAVRREFWLLKHPRARRLVRRLRHQARAAITKE